MRERLLSLVSGVNADLRHVIPGGRILDAGCGVGRDALAFARLGYDVVAFDASLEMVRLTRARVGPHVPVHLMRFEEVAWCGEFDGVWTCASLLHVPSISFAEVGSRVVDALRSGGAWHMSFKLGQGERFTNGRLFVDHTQENLSEALTGWSIRISEMWISEDVRPGRKQERWVNAVAVRSP
ncbi:class I SAM-dependent methyltransferase [Microvirga arabica]|uniref:Class I SAM-dependent methyltransferase n=1 Tax=Microvirga arabica TaxID=1128671 RepID=A0ABV6YB06_9HYPH